MPRTRHPFHGVVCPKCGNDLYCTISLVPSGVKLGALISEEKRGRWPEEPATPPAEITEWVDSIDNTILLDAIDQYIGKKKGSIYRAAMESKERDPFNDIGRTSRFPCPVCHTPLQIQVSLRLLEAILFEDPGISDSYQTKGLSAREVEVVEMCRRSGVIRAFAEAIDFHFGENPGRPKNLDRFFLRFLQIAVKKSVPEPLYRSLRIKFPKSAIALWQGPAVGAITIDDAIYQFVPEGVIRESSTDSQRKNRGGHLGRYVSATPEELPTWVKTKHGYVPSDSKIFLRALRQRSAGDFEIPG